MKDRRVAILYQFPLVGKAIEQLLQSFNGIEVVASLPYEAVAWNHILPLHPDVVIKVGEDELEAATLPPLPPEEALRIIYLETTGNDMCLCHARQMKVTRIEDLIQAVYASDERPEGEVIST